MSLYVPQDRIELHNALASQLLVRHADALSDRGISRDEACKFAHCATAREQIHASLSGGWPEFQAFIGSDGHEFGDSRSPEIWRLMERCADLADLIDIERRSLRDAFVSGAVAAVAVDAGNRHLTADYWREPSADAAIKTGVADLSVDDHRLFSRFLIERDRFERWLNGSPHCGMRPIRREVSSSAASVSARESLDWEPLWNLDQTLIWITVRDMNLVKLASSRAKVPDSFIIAQDEKKLLIPAEVAVAQLTNALSGRRLAAAIDGEPVNPHVFCEAILLALGAPLFQAYLSPPYPASPQDHRTSIYGFRIPADDIIRLWPSMSRTADEVTSSFADAASRPLASGTEKPPCGRAAQPPKIRDICTSILTEWLDDGKEEASRPREKDILARVKRAKPDAGRNQTIAIWKEVRAVVKDVDWSRRGPRR